MHPRIECVQADAAVLPYDNRSFDLVLCAEVLEHVPPGKLERVCAEIERVARGPIVVGVPYRQDICVGRTTCVACGRQNPPWGHINRFDEQQLEALSPRCPVERLSYVSRSRERTNALSALLMDWSGNPYGSYAQEEPCIHCGCRLVSPPERNWAKKILTRAAVWSQRAGCAFLSESARWMHVVFSIRG